MTLPVSIREEAITEIRTIQLYLEGEKHGLGERFLVELLACLELIGRYPRAYQVRHHIYRYGQLADLQYHVIYAIEEGTVVVYRVRHMHRRTLKQFFGG